MSRRYTYIIIVYLVIINNKIFSQKMGGEIIYNKEPFPYTYEISLINYSMFPSIDNYSSIKIYTGDGDSAIVARTDSTILCNDILKSTYTFLHIYLGNGMYIISSLDTNTLSGIINFPNSALFPFILQDTVNLNSFFAPLNSPQFIADPIIKAEVNKILRYNLTVYDPDGDSLVYYLADLDYTANQYYLPAGFSINSLSGEIIWNKPDTIGKFQFKATIQEWRNVGGIPNRIATTDKIFSIIVDTLHSDGQFLGISNWTTNTNGDYSSNVPPKTNFSVSLIYQDSLADSVDLFSYSETFLLSNTSTFTTFSVPKQKIGFYSWTPDSLNIRNNPYIVTFRGRSYLDTICHEQDLTLMIYVDSLFSSVAEDASENNFHIYPNPAHSELNIVAFPSTITIYNVFGEKVYQSQYLPAGQASSIPDTQYSINVTAWAKGMYFIELIDEKGIRVGTEKVIIE